MALHPHAATYEANRKRPPAILSCFRLALTRQWIAMDAFKIADLLKQREHSGKRYLEFLRVPTLSVGLYLLPAGDVDPQKPHEEDEVYYVLRGRAIVRVGAEARAVEPGSVIFVPARVDHRFHTITAQLELLVFFGPAEGSGVQP
jgi:mannose-6-phosphate isomerase-like protein (cupin superfamily)